MPRGERILIGFFLFLSLAATYFALDFQLPEARSFPLLIGISTSLLIIAFFIISSSDVLSDRMRPFIVDDLFMKIDGAVAQSTDPEEDGVRQAKERQLIGLFGGFGLVAWVIGLTFAVPIFLLVVMRRFAHENWKMSIAVTAGTCAFLYVTFVAVLRMKLHFGLLSEL